VLVAVVDDVEEVAEAEAEVEALLWEWILEGG
jgi:hypothetical protein